MLIVNNQGQISGKIKIPANIPAGTKLVQFYGDKGSYGEATYTGKKTITIEERRRVIAARRVDPLAQTFTLNESRHIGAVVLKVNRKILKINFYLVDYKAKDAFNTFYVI